MSGAGVSLLRVYGKKSPKSKWKFTKAGEDWFCFAGLWRPMPGGGDAFTLLTTEPGPDVEPIHDRQMVILKWGQLDFLARSDSARDRASEALASWQPYAGAGQAVRAGTWDLPRATATLSARAADRGAASARCID